jgi:hypothetical protein
MAQTNDIARMRREMDADDGKAPPFWDPVEGDSLVGVLLRYEQRETKMGECRVAVVREHVDDKDAEDEDPKTWSVFLTRNVLKNEFERQAPQPGDAVGLKYFGLQEGRNGGQPYHLYRLRVLRAGAPPPSGTITTAAPATTDDDEAPL